MINFWGTFHNFQTKYFCKSLFYSTEAEILLLDHCTWKGNTYVEWVPEGRYFLVEFEEDSSNNQEYIFELTTALFLLIAEKGNKRESDQCPALHRTEEFPQTQNYEC